MSFLLTSDFEDSFMYNGETYHVNMAFDNILLLFEMFEDELIQKVEKPLIAIQMLLKEDIHLQSYQESSELLRFIMKEFLELDIDKKSESAEPPPYDFKKDAELIYASFYSVYKMDLFEQRGKLHWKKFLALLINLDDDSKFKHIVSIRKMKVPSSKEASQEYRDHIIKMKQIYSLDERSTEEKVNDQLSDFAKTLKAVSVKK